MPGTFFTSVGAFSNEDIDNILEPRQPQFPATPPTGMLDNGTDISDLYAPVSVGSAAALTGYLVDGVDIANIFAVAGSVSVSYTATPAAGSVDEGASLTINISGTNTPAGDLYWTIDPTGGGGSDSQAGDFVATSGGPVTYNGTSGSFSVSTVADTTTEGEETFTVQVRTGSTGGPIVATTTSITINDTSTGSYTLGGPASMDEGVTESFPFDGTGIANQTYYWRIEHIDTVPGDFTGATSSSFAYAGAPVNIDIQTVADSASEGPETFTLAVYEDAGYTTLAVDKTITINDTSSLSVAVSGPASVDEGANATFNVTGTGSAQTLYWTVNFNSSSDAGDFTATSGSFAFDGSNGTFDVSIDADSTTEGPETFLVEVRSGSIAGPILDTSSAVTINDTSTDYSISGTTPVNEGAASTFTVTGGTAQTLYWTVLNGTTTNADFDTVSGSFVYNGTSGNFDVTTVADATTEGNETFQVQLRTGSTGGPVVGLSNTVTITDTSQDPTYAISGSPTTVDEGSTVTFTVTTTDVADGTTLYWSTTGTVDAADFTDGQMTGSVTINSNTGSIDRTLENDLSSGEGSETFQLQLRTGSVGGTIVDTSNTITVNDTSSLEWTGSTSINASTLDSAGHTSEHWVFDLSISSAGTWQSVFEHIGDGGSGDEVISSNTINGTWITPTGAGVGNSYEVRFTHVSASGTTPALEMRVGDSPIRVNGSPVLNAGTDIAVGNSSAWLPLDVTKEAADTMGPHQSGVSPANGTWRIEIGLLGTSTALLTQDITIQAGEIV